MKVDFTTFGPALPDNSNKASRAEPSTTGAEVGTQAGTTTGAGADQTRFSFDEARVQSLAAQVLAQPDVREAKVQSLQQAIINGNYSVSASQLADALANDLGGAQS